MQYPERNPSPVAQGTAVPFTAVCPHCREARLKVPYKKRGKLVDCPKCGRPFMLVPEDGHSAPLVDYDLDAPGRERRKRKPSAEPAAEPAATATAAAPEPTAPATSDPTTTAPPGELTPTPFAVPPERKDADVPLRMALAGIGFVGVAVLASQFPYGRLVGTVLAAVGLLFALLSLLGLEKRPWLGWAGVGLNLFALLLLVLLPGWLGISEWTPQGNPDAGPKPVTAVGRDGSLPKPAEWVDASQAVWEQGDVRVAVTSVTIGPANPEPSAPQGKKRETVLRIGLKVTNVGVARAVEFKGWAAPPDEPKLTTAAGKPVPVKPAGLPAGAATIYPGKSAELALTFEPPAGAPEDYRLELPAQTFGGADPVKFQVPQAMLRGGRPQP